MKYTFRQKTINMTLLLIAAFLGIYLAYGLIKSQAQDIKSYDPRDYGLPTQIGIYQIVAVVAPANMSCPIAGMYILILQSRVNQNQSSQNLPLHIQPLQSSDIQMLERLVGGQVTLSYSSGDMTLEQIERQAEDVKKSATLSDCLPIGQRFNNLVTPSN